MRWQRARKRQLAREPLCRACEAEGHATAASDVDHVEPISTGGAVWSASNLQSLCKAHHSIKTNQYDLKGRDWRAYERRGCDEHGVPLDPLHPWRNQPRSLAEFMNDDDDATRH
jgi:5-methylcytosine-specific restriction enzyme A